MIALTLWPYNFVRSRPSYTRPELLLILVHKYLCIKAQASLFTGTFVAIPMCGSQWQILLQMVRRAVVRGYNPRSASSPPTLYAFFPVPFLWLAGAYFAASLLTRLDSTLSSLVLLLTLSRSQRHSCGHHWIPWSTVCALDSSKRTRPTRVSRDFDWCQPALYACWIYSCPFHTWRLVETKKKWLLLARQLEERSWKTSRGSLVLNYWAWPRRISRTIRGRGIVREGPPAMCLAPVSSW